VRYRLNISAAEEAVSFLLDIVQSAKPERRDQRTTSSRRKLA
jgi:hypothetical protein